MFLLGGLSTVPTGFCCKQELSLFWTASLLYRGFAPHFTQHTRVHILGSKNRISGVKKRINFSSQALNPWCPDAKQTCPYWTVLLPTEVDILTDKTSANGTRVYYPMNINIVSTHILSMINVLKKKNVSVISKESCIHTLKNECVIKKKP